MANKLKLGFDIDNVILPTAEGFVEFFNTKHGTKHTILDINNHDFAKFVGITREEDAMLWNEFYQTDRFKELSLYPEVLEVFQQLSELGELHLRTSRPDFLTDITNRQLSTISHLVSDITHCNYYLTDKPKKTKAESCKESGIILLVDDCLQYVDECLEKGLHALLFDRNNSHGWAKTEPTHKNAARIVSLYEVKPYVERNIIELKK